MNTAREIIKEKEEGIAQLEKQLIELIDVQQQHAATTAASYNRRSFTVPKKKSKLSIRLFS